MKKSMLVMATLIALVMSAMAGAVATTEGGITSPANGDIIITNVLELRAFEPDAAEDGVAAWAVRSAVDNPNCDTSKPDLAGWRGGTLQADVVSEAWDGTYFAVDINVSAWERGEYCFAFNPEPFGEFRDNVTFSLGTPDSKDACKDGGWETFGEFRNQGECVASFQANERAGK